MPFLTAAPTKEEKTVPHFLFGNLSIEKKPSLGWWIKEIEKIKNKLIVGGTAFYIYSLMKGVPMIEISENTKKQILEFKNNEEKIEFLEKNNWKINFQKQDLYRINRALEFYLETGFSFETYSKKYKENIELIIINPPIETLEKNIKDRAYKNIDLYLEEVEKSPYHENLNDIIGYEECLQTMNGKITKSHCIDSIIQKTLKYAKYQKKFLKKISSFADKIVD